MSLTDRAIQNTRPKGKEFTLHDGGGLYLRIKPNGSRLWRWNYWVLGKQKFLSIGPYPEVTLKQARDAVFVARFHLSKGTDPGAHLKEKKRAILETPGSRPEETDTAQDDTIRVEQISVHSPFRSLALAWFNHWKLGKNPSYVSRTRSRLTDNLFPVLGTKQIDEIEAPDIMQMAQAVESRLGRGTELAQRSIQIAGTIFRFAIVHRVLKRNPAADLKPSDILKPVETDNRAHVDQAAFPALLVAIDEYKGREIVKCAAWLMILVFLRTSEMIGGQWPEIDDREDLWRVPRERMKKVRSTRQKVKGPHLVPLARQTKDILARCKALAGKSPFILPGEFSKSGRIHGNSLLEMLERIGYKSIQTGHGFRGLASTILNERGFHPDHIEAQLGHIKGDKTRAAYNHARYLDQRRKLMQAWADYVDEALQRGYESRQQKAVTQAAVD